MSGDRKPTRWCRRPECPKDAHVCDYELAADAVVSVEFPDRPKVH